MTAVTSMVASASKSLNSPNLGFSIPFLRYEFATEEWNRESSFELATLHVFVEFSSIPFHVLRQNPLLLRQKHLEIPP